MPKHDQHRCEIIPIENGWKTQCICGWEKSEEYRWNILETISRHYGENCE